MKISLARATGLDEYLAFDGPSYSGKTGGELCRRGLALRGEKPVFLQLCKAPPRVVDARSQSVVLGLAGGVRLVRRYGPRDADNAEDQDRPCAQRWREGHGNFFGSLSGVLSLL